MVVCHTLIYMLPIHLFVYSCFSHMYIFLSIWDDTHIFNASIFHRQLMIIHTLLMHVFYICFFAYTCFLWKYFSSSVDGNTHASSACILHMFFAYACFLCKYFSSSVNDNTNAFYACILYIYIIFFVYTCFLCKYFSSSVDSNTHASYAYIFGRPNMARTRIFYLNCLEPRCRWWQLFFMRCRGISFERCKLNSKKNREHLLALFFFLLKFQMPKRIFINLSRVWRWNFVDVLLVIFL